MSPRLLAGAALVALLAGCAGRTGAPAADVARTAATAAGVSVVAEAGAWRGWPADLARLVTPVRVTLANNAPVPVRVDSLTFSVLLPGGGRLAAMLPGDVHAAAATPPPAALPRTGLALGPTRERSGPGWALNDPGPDPRPDPTHEADRPWSLPSEDMLSLALPDGTLPPGETASGFVYFERAPEGLSDALLVIPLVDARSGEALGVVEVPLAQP